MKKILFLAFIFLFFNISFGAEIADIDEIEPVLFEPSIRLIEENEVPVLLEEEISPYSKKALKAIITKEYDLESPDGMFQEQLKARFERGPVKEAGTRFAFFNNFTQTIDNNSNLKFNPSLINVSFKGKFRSEKEDFCLLLDTTPDMHENFFHTLVLDAWVSTKRVPNHTVMLGTSRPMVGFEGGQSTYTLPFINRSQTARNFGKVRKTGLRVKGDYKYVDYEVGGYSSDTWYSEFFPGVETDLWVNFKPLANIKDKFGSLNLAGGFVAGSRNAQSYMVESAAVKYNYKRLNFLAEYQNADGSNGGSGLTDAQRQGYNLTLAYRLTKKLELLARYDVFDPDKNISENNTKEYTGGINYYILGQTLRLCLNYIYCHNETKPNSHKLILGTQILL